MGGAKVKSHRVPKIAELVAGELRKQILTGELKAGESLSTEAALMEEYEVSRPTLREALRLLESQQLIASRRGSHDGPVITHPDAAVSAQSFAMLLQLRDATLADIYEFRTIMEPTAARLAAEKASRKSLVELRQILDDELTTDDKDEFTTAAWRFHTELARLSGNVTMGLFAEVLEQISQRHAAELVFATTPKQIDRSRKSHAKLLTLLEKGDAAAAERHWRNHMEAAGEVLLRQPNAKTIVELLG